MTQFQLETRVCVGKSTALLFAISIAINFGWKRSRVRQWRSCTFRLCVHLCTRLLYVTYAVYRLTVHRSEQAGGNYGEQRQWVIPMYYTYRPDVCVLHVLSISRRGRCCSSDQELRPGSVTAAGHPLLAMILFYVHSDFVPGQDRQRAADTFLLVKKDCHY